MKPITRFSRRAPATQSTPATCAVPPLGRARPTRILIVVVLPAPLGPTRPKISPRSTLIVSRSSATCLPYFLVSSRVWTAGWPADISPSGGARPSAALPDDFQFEVVDLPAAVRAGAGPLLLAARQVGDADAHAES